MIKPEEDSKKDLEEDIKIDCEIFYEVLEFMNIMKPHRETAEKLTEKLAKHGLLGEYSDEIIAGKDRHAGIIKESKAVWWYAMLCKVGPELGLGISLEPISSSGPLNARRYAVDISTRKFKKCSLNELWSSEITGISYSMEVSLDRKLSRNKIFQLYDFLGLFINATGKEFQSISLLHALYGEKHPRVGELFSFIRVESVWVDKITPDFINSVLKRLDPSKITELNIRGGSVNDDFEFLEGFDSLRSLVIQKSFKWESFETFLRREKLHTMLEEIVLRENRFPTQPLRDWYSFASRLGDYLRGPVVGLLGNFILLKKLNLEDCKLTPEDIKSLFGSLSLQKSLVELHIGGNSNSFEGVSLRDLDLFLELRVLSIRKYGQFSSKMIKDLLGCERLKLEILDFGDASFKEEDLWNVFLLSRRVEKIRGRNVQVCLNTFG